MFFIYGLVDFKIGVYDIENYFFLFFKYGFR